MRKSALLIIFSITLITILLYPGAVLANHSCGNTSDEFTAEGASTHGCGQSSHGGEEYAAYTYESVPAEKGTDGGNRDTAIQTVQKYNSGDKDKDYAVDANYFPDADANNDGVTKISEVQQDLANDVEQVQQEVEGKAAAVTQESQAAVAAKDCYGAWDCGGDSWCAGAGSYEAGEAGACVTGDNVNRSAAEIAVAYCETVGVEACQQTIAARPDDFLGKTDYDAINNKQTTQKDIIDELLVFVGGPPSPEATGGEVIQTYAKKAEELQCAFFCGYCGGFCADVSGAGCKAEAGVKYATGGCSNADGSQQVNPQCITATGDKCGVGKLNGEVVQLYNTKTDVNEKGEVTNVYFLLEERAYGTACVTGGAAGAVGNKCWVSAQDPGLQGLALKVGRGETAGIAPNLVVDLKATGVVEAAQAQEASNQRMEAALGRVEEFLNNNDGDLPVRDEGLNLFWAAHPEFFADLSQAEAEAVKNAAKDTVFLIGGYIAKANEAIVTGDESIASSLPAEYQEAVRAEIKRQEAVGGAARDLALVPAAQDPSQVAALKQQEQNIFNKFGLVEEADQAEAQGFARIIAGEIGQANAERLKEVGQAAAEIEPILALFESVVVAERNRLILNQDSTSGQRVAQAIIQIADTSLTSAEKISAALDLVRPGCTTDPSQRGCAYLRQNITNIINQLPQFTATAQNYVYQNLPDPSQLTLDQIKNLTESAAVAWRNANPYATVDSTTTNLAYLWLKDNCNSVNSTFAPPGCQVFTAKHSLPGAKEELDNFDVALIAQLRGNVIDTAKARTALVNALVSQGKTEVEAIQLLRDTQKTQEQIAQIAIPGVKDLVHNWEVVGALASYSWESISSFFEGSPTPKEAGYTVAAAKLYELTQGAALRGETFGGHVTTVLGVPILPLCATGTCLMDNGLRITAAVADTLGNHSGADTLVRLAESVNPNSSVRPIHPLDSLSGGEQVASGILRGIGFAGDVGLALTGTFSYENKLQAAGFGTTEASIDQAHYIAAQTLKENGVNSDSPSYQLIYDSLVESTLAKLPTTESAARDLNIESMAYAAFLGLGPLGAGAREADVLLQSKIVSPVFHWMSLIGGGSYAFGGAGINFTNLLQQNSAQISNLNSLNTNPNIDPATLDRIISAVKIQQNKQTWDAGLQLGATALTQAAFFYSPVKETLFTRKTIQVPTEITRSQIADKLGRNDFEIVEVKPVGLSGIEAKLAGKKGFTIRDSLNAGDSIKIQPGEEFELVVRFTDGARPETYPRITPDSKSIPVFRYSQSLRDLADTVRSVFRKSTPAETADAANATTARPVTTGQPLLAAPTDLEGHLLIPTTEPPLGGDATVLAPQLQPGQRAVFTPSDGSPPQLVTGSFTGGLTVQTLKPGVTPEQVSSLPTTTEAAAEAAAEARVTNQVLTRLGEALKVQPGDLVGAVRAAVGGVTQLSAAAVNALTTVVKSAGLVRPLTPEQIAKAVEAGDFEALRGWTPAGRTVVAWLGSFVPGEGVNEYQVLVTRFEQARAGNLTEDQLQLENAVLAQALAQVHIQAQVAKAEVPAPAPAAAQMAEAPAVPAPVQPQPVVLEPVSVPQAAALPECVTGDTKLRRKRRKRSENSEDSEDQSIGVSEYQDIRIDEIQPGDEIVSLNEATGEFEWSRVKRLMDKGVQTVWQVKTESGKTIRTTSEHPYLVAREGQLDEEESAERFGLAFAFRELEGDVDQSGSNQGQRESDTSFEVQVDDVNHGNILSNQIAINKDSVPRNISNVNTNQFSGQPVSVKLGTMKAAAYQAADRLTDNPESTFSTASLSFGLDNIFTYASLAGLWMKVKYLKRGDVIATVDGWEEIRTIEKMGRKPVYDIEVEGTHNFVGNGIVAHNTASKLAGLVQEGVDKVAMATARQEQKQAIAAADETILGKVRKDLGADGQIDKLEEMVRRQAEVELKGKDISNSLVRAYARLRAREAIAALDNWENDLVMRLAAIDAQVRLANANAEEFNRVKQKIWAEKLAENAGAFSDKFLRRYAKSVFTDEYRDFVLSLLDDRIKLISEFDEEIGIRGVVDPVDQVWYQELVAARNRLELYPEDVEVLEEAERVWATRIVDIPSRDVKPGKADTSGWLEGLRGYWFVGGWPGLVRKAVLVTTTVVSPLAATLGGLLVFGPAKSAPPAVAPQAVVRLVAGSATTHDAANPEITYRYLPGETSYNFADISDQTYVVEPAQLDEDYVPGERSTVSEGVIIGNNFYQEAAGVGRKVIDLEGNELVLIGSAGPRTYYQTGGQPTQVQLMTVKISEGDEEKEVLGFYNSRNEVVLADFGVDAFGNPLKAYRTDYTWGIVTPQVLYVVPAHDGLPDAYVLPDKNLLGFGEAEAIFGRDSLAEFVDVNSVSFYKQVSLVLENNVTRWSKSDLIYDPLEYVTEDGRLVARMAREASLGLAGTDVLRDSPGVVSFVYELYDQNQPTGKFVIFRNGKMELVGVGRVDVNGDGSVVMPRYVRRLVDIKPDYFDNQRQKNGLWVQYDNELVNPETGQATGELLISRDGNYEVIYPVYWRGVMPADQTFNAGNLEGLYVDSETLGLLTGQVQDKRVIAYLNAKGEVVAWRIDVPSDAPAYLMTPALAEALKDKRGLAQVPPPNVFRHFNLETGEVTFIYDSDASHGLNNLYSLGRLEISFDHLPSAEELESRVRQTVAATNLVRTGNQYRLVDFTGEGRINFLAPEIYTPALDKPVRIVIHTDEQPGSPRLWTTTGTYIGLSVNGLSSHMVIGPEKPGGGVVAVQMLPMTEDLVARSQSVENLNTGTISIEFAGRTGQIPKALLDKYIEVAAKKVVDMMALYEIPFREVLAHSQLNPGIRTDPGDDVMIALMAKIDSELTQRGLTLGQPSEAGVGQVISVPVAPVQVNYQASTLYGSPYFRIESLPETPTVSADELQVPIGEIFKPKRPRGYFQEGPETPGHYGFDMVFTAKYQGQDVPVNPIHPDAVLVAGFADLMSKGLANRLQMSGVVEFYYLNVEQDGIVKPYLFGLAHLKQGSVANTLVEAEDNGGRVIHPGFVGDTGSSNGIHVHLTVIDVGQLMKVGQADDLQGALDYLFKDDLIIDRSVFVDPSVVMPGLTKMSFQPPEAFEVEVLTDTEFVGGIVSRVVEQARLNRDIGGAENYDVALESGIGYSTIHTSAAAGAEVAMRKVFDLHRQVNYAGRAVETLSAGERFMYDLTQPAFAGVTSVQWRGWQQAENMDGARYSQLLAAIRGLVAESQGSVEADVAAGKVLGFGSTRSEANWGDKMAVFAPDGRYIGLVLIVDEPQAGDWYQNLSTAIYRDENWGDLHWMADLSQEVYDRLPQGREARGGRPAIVVSVDQIEELAKESSGVAGNLALPLPVGLLTSLWRHRVAVGDIASEFVLGRKKAGERASGVVKSWWEKNSGQWWKRLGDLDRQLRVWEGAQPGQLRIENIPGFLANGGEIKFTFGKTYTAANAQEFTRDLQNPSGQPLYGRTATLTGPGFSNPTVLILMPDSFVSGLVGGSGQTAPLPTKFGPQPNGTFNVGVYQQVGRAGEIVVQAGNDVSRWHFQFVKDPLGWVAIEDLDSSSGTWINNQKIVKITRVKEGDIITIGYSSPKSFKIRRVDYSNGVVTLEPSRSTTISLSAGKTLYLKREIAILNGQSIGTRGNVLVQTDKDGRSRTSRRHAVIEIGWGKVTVRDQRSTNGTFVNGQEISSPAQLRSGDLVSFGDESNSLKFVRTEGNKAVFSQASGRFENTNPKARIYSKNWVDKIEDILIRPWLGVSHQTVATLLERELQVNGWEMSRAEQLAETFKDKIKGKDGERLSRPERNAILLRLNMPDIKRWRPFGLASVSDAELLYVAARIAQREYSFAKAAGLEYSEIDKQANAFTTKLELFAGEIGLDLSTTYQESALVGSETKAVGGIGGTWYGLQVGSLDNFFVSEKDISSSKNPAQVALEVVLHERGHRDQGRQNWHPWGKPTYNEASTQAMVFLMIEEINHERVTFNSYANQGAKLYINAMKKLQTNLKNRGIDSNLALRSAVASARTGKYDGEVKIGSQRVTGIRSLFDQYFGKGAFDRHMSGESDYNIASQYHGVTIADIFFEKLFPRRQASRSYKELQGQTLKEEQITVFESRVPAPKGLVRAGEGWGERINRSVRLWQLRRLANKIRFYDPPIRDIIEMISARDDAARVAQAMVRLGQKLHVLNVREWRIGSALGILARRDDAVERAGLIEAGAERLVALGVSEEEMYRVIDLWAQTEDLARVRRLIDQGALRALQSLNEKLRAKPGVVEDYELGLKNRMEELAEFDDVTERAKALGELVFDLGLLGFSSEDIEQFYLQMALKYAGNLPERIKQLSETNTFREFRDLGKALRSSLFEGVPVSDWDMRGTWMELLGLPDPAARVKDLAELVGLLSLTSTNASSARETVEQLIRNDGDGAAARRLVEFLTAMNRAGEQEPELIKIAGAVIEQLRWDKRLVEAAPRLAQPETTNALTRLSQALKQNAINPKYILGQVALTDDVVARADQLTEIVSRLSDKADISHDLVFLIQDLVKVGDVTVMKQVADYAGKLLDVGVGKGSMHLVVGMLIETGKAGELAVRYNTTADLAAVAEFHAGLDESLRGTYIEGEMLKALVARESFIDDLKLLTAWKRRLMNLRPVEERSLYSYRVDNQLRTLTSVQDLDLAIENLRILLDDFGSLASSFGYRDRLLGLVDKVISEIRGSGGGIVGRYNEYTRLMTGLGFSKDRILEILSGLPELKPAELGKPVTMDELVNDLAEVAVNKDRAAGERFAAVNTLLQMLSPNVTYETVVKEAVVAYLRDLNMDMGQQDQIYSLLVVGQRQSPERGRILDAVITGDWGRFDREMVGDDESFSVRVRVQFLQSRMRQWEWKGQLGVSMNNARVGRLLPEWVNDNAREAALLSYLKLPGEKDKLDKILNHRRVIELVEAEPTIQSRIFVFTLSSEERLNQFWNDLNDPKVTQGQLLRHVLGVADRAFLADQSNSWRAVIDLTDRSKGVILGETFNTPHATIVRSIGGDLGDFLAVIKEGNRVGIDRADNGRLSDEDRRVQALYGVRVLLTEGADPNFRFFFRDAAGLEEDYTLAEVAAGRLSDLINPYAVVAERFDYQDIVWGPEAQAQKLAGQIYLTRGKGTLEIEIPNAAFGRESELGGTLVRQGYDTDTQVALRKGARGAVQTRSLTLGELAGISRNFSFSIGDRFDQVLDSQRVNVLLRTLTPGVVELVRLDGEIVSLSQDEFRTQLRDGVLKFTVPSPKLAVSAVKSGEKGWLVLLHTGRVTVDRKAQEQFIGALLKDGRFIFTWDTTAHNQMLNRMGLVETDVVIKIVRGGADLMWTGGGDLDEIRLLMDFVNRQQLGDEVRFKLTVADNQALNFEGTLRAMRQQRPEFFAPVGSSEGKTTVFESRVPAPKGLVRVGEGWGGEFRRWLADKQPKWYGRLNTVLYRLQQWGIYRGEIVHESYEIGFGATESRGLGGTVINGSYLGIWRNNYPDKDMVRYWEDIVDEKQTGEDLVVVDLGSGAGKFGLDLLRLWVDPQAAIEVPEQLKRDVERMRQLIVKAKSKGLRLKYVGITDAQVGQRLGDVVWEKEIEGAGGINLAFTFIGNQRLSQVLTRQGIQKVDVFMDVLFSSYLRPETRKVVAQDVMDWLNPGGVVLAQRILFEAVDVAQTGGKLTETDGIGVVVEREGLQGQSLQAGMVEVLPGSGELIRSSRKEIVVGLATKNGQREIKLVVEGNSQEEILDGLARQLDEAGVVSGTEFTLRIPIVTADAAPTTVEWKLRYTTFKGYSLQGEESLQSQDLESLITESPFDLELGQPTNKLREGISPEVVLKALDVS